MGNKAIYTIDTCSLNTLLQEDRIYYRKHFVPLWNNITEMIKNDEIISHREVYDEIINGGIPECVQWAKANRGIFKEHDFFNEGNLLFQIGDKHPMFLDQKKYKPNHADPWLVAQAKLNNLIIITEEVDGENKIPRVAKDFEVKSLNIFGLIKSKNWKV